MATFYVNPWPPGRSCRDGAQKLLTYKGELGSFAKDISDISEPLTKTNRRFLLASIKTVVELAQRGELEPVTAVGGRRVGDVESIEATGGKILEIRMENQADWKSALFPKKRLRIYFAEPQFEDAILLLLAAPKDEGRLGLLAQTHDAKFALRRAEEWSSQQTRLRNP